MPKDKDRKRLVRERMAKTGESYAAARAVVVARVGNGERERATYAAPRKEWPELAGCSDAAVRSATGKTWSQWVTALDGAEAFRQSHRDIARSLREVHGLDGWWSQMVTVGYERIRGMRDVGQRPDGSYDANKSRTFPAPASQVFRMFTNGRSRKKWLPEGWRRLRTSIEDKSLRVDWEDGTQVNVYFVAKGPSKCTVAVQHAKLRSKADISRAKELWNERLNALATLLT